MYHQHRFIINLLHSAHQPRLLLVVALLLGLPWLTGCGGGTASGMFNTAQNAALPAEVTATPELLDIKSLASLERNSPFKNLLELKLETEAAANAPEGEPGQELQAEAAPPEDPFVGVSLGGIYFSKKSSMAIINISGKTQVVHAGDQFSIDVNGALTPIKVTKIDKDKVTLLAPDQPAEVNTKELSVPILVGYSKTAAATGSAPAANSNPLKPEYLVKDAETLAIPKEITDIIKKNILGKSDASPPGAPPGGSPYAH